MNDTMLQWIGQHNYTPSVSSEIYQLRREGRLDEARQKAEDLLSQDNMNQDVMMAYAWTLIDICKREQQKGNMDEALLLFDKLSQLKIDTTNGEFPKTLIKNIQHLKLTLNPFFEQIQEAKKMSQNGDRERAMEILSQLGQLAADGYLPEDVHEQYGWTIYYYLKDHISSLESEEVRKRLRDYINLKNERPSNLHHAILNFALKYSEQDGNFKLLSFLCLWGPNNLKDCDFYDSQGNDGKSYPPLMSRIARAVTNYPLNEIQEFVERLSCRKDEFIEMMKEHYFWKLYHRTKEGVDESSWKLFEEYLSFFPEAPASSAHSKVLGLAERLMKEESIYRFYEFFIRWDPKKLRDADWEEQKGENGEVYPPLAIKSLKKVRRSIEILSDEQVGDLQWLIDLYDTAVEKFPDDDWNIRSKALLYLRVGQLENAKSIYKDLCLKKGTLYYIWSEFADCCEDTRLKTALLCKALSLKKNEDFIGKIRLELARQLIKAKKYENAVVELEQYKKHYTEMEWHINSEFDILLGQCSSVTPAKDKNATFYEEYILIAEEYAYADIPYTEMVLVDERKNVDGKVVMTFVNGESIGFTINKKSFSSLRNSHNGQVWSFKLYKDETEKTIVKYIPLIVVPSLRADWLPLPIKYGYIQHVNTEKKVYHIYSTDSNLVYNRFEEQVLEKGDFVTFRQYTKKIKEEERVFTVDVKKCEKSEGLAQFKSRIVVIDHMDPQKQLFHFVSSDPKRISGNLPYDKTELRLAIGDFIKIHYYKRIKKMINAGQETEVIEVLKAEVTDEVNSDLVKEIEGTLELKYRGHYHDGIPDFAFIGDYYVHKTILDKYNIFSDCYVKAKAIYAGDDKWKVFEITKE
ncbi:MAG: tetratricopeptide repeat protein [Porphyromonas endodontalis]|uniref:tetratricopeptide repeat protein n=1 Tax=Porphyromonas endodontalis TaxID=28124 RepID=UPI003F9F15ED